jgi:Putative heavy-metal-binding
MRIEDVEVHVGDLDRPYRMIDTVKATVKAPTLFHNAPSLDSVNSRLREQALKMGANAVINVTYKRGISLTSWKALTATGTAVAAQPHADASLAASVADQLRS